jgi:aminoglycoside N3'-acetyltransferase
MSFQGVIPELGMKGMALAAGEIYGRRILRRIPKAKQRLGRWARGPSGQQAAVGLDQVTSALKSLGVESGRHVVVHSSWENLSGLNEKPTRVISALQDLIGREGTLLMPSHPLVSKAASPPLYDVAKTPSSLGLLTECLRRASGVVRSPVPEAPVCALGQDAAEYAVDFRETSGGTPYGKGSPWHRLAEHRGLIVFLGIGVMRSNTMQHVAFDLLEDENPIRNYYCETVWRVTSGDREETWAIRRHHPALERYLATVAFGSLLAKSGLLASRVVGGIFLGVLEARDFLDWHLPLAHRTGMPYFGFPSHRRLLMRRTP